MPEALALSLLRITEPTSGSITIDGIDISQIGLRDLRERVVRGFYQLTSR